MDEFAKHSASYQLDQEILDARGINMTVEEVAGLPTSKYSARVQALHLNVEDFNFLKGLRRRIKNRLASQNSRRRSMEHLRRLTRELRAVRACRDVAVEERRTLLARRDLIRAHCTRLRRHLVQILRERSDPTEVPEEEIEEVSIDESQIEPSNESPRKITETKPLISNFKNRIEDKKCFQEVMEKERIKDIFVEDLEEDIKVFECRIDKLVQQSVNHIYKDKDLKEMKRVCAKTIFITEKSMKIESLDDTKVAGENGVLNLSLKQERRKSHGRKQSAPRRIAYIYPDVNDDVLDLKIKKEPQ
ncbi:unnamed protein product [Parnassius apollo]|uniref:(apollo) hypothetical protein n=1 Tax=Parnassius apollo TaxID=110799 RepID=A0A8S3X483_PARAO|nr:unnamed protein product [Parnassius apollo]